MMKRFVLLLAFVGMHMAYAQEDTVQEEASLDGGTINTQFDYLYKKSGNYRAEGRRYEVVRLNDLNKIRQNIADTIATANKKATELRATISEHQATISSLNKQLEDTKQNLNAVTEEKDSISLLGGMVSKGTYNFVLWTIIIGLFMLLLLFIYRFRNSNYLTQEAKTKLSDLESEYENHRRRALEREQKISRQLQDEINKYKKSN